MVHPLEKCHSTVLYLPPSRSPDSTVAIFSSVSSNVTGAAELAARRQIPSPEPHWSSHRPRHGTLGRPTPLNRRCHPLPARHCCYSSTSVCHSPRCLLIFAETKIATGKPGTARASGAGRIDTPVTPRRRRRVRSACPRPVPSAKRIPASSQHASSAARPTRSCARVVCPAPFPTVTKRGRRSRRKTGRQACRAIVWSVGRVLAAVGPSRARACTVLTKPAADSHTPIRCSDETCNRRLPLATGDRFCSLHGCGVTGCREHQSVGCRNCPVRTYHSPPPPSQSVGVRVSC